MWILSGVVCFIFIQVSTSFNMRERMGLIDDIIEYELDHPVSRNFQNITSHIKVYNSLLRNVSNSFGKQTIHKLKASVLEIWNNGRPSSIYFNDFPSFKTKFGWDDAKINGVRSLLNETERLWDEFDEKCRTNKLDSPETLENEEY